MSTIYRFYAEKRPGFDIEAQGLLGTMQGYLHIAGLEGIRIFNRYDIQGLNEENCEAAGRLIFSEPQCDNLYREELPAIEGAHTIFAVEALPGQYDQRADSAAQCVQILTKDRPLVRVAKVYAFMGEISESDLLKMKKHLINPVENREAALSKPETLQDDVAEPEAVFSLEGFISADDAALEGLRQQYGLAMDLGDLRYMQVYFRDEEHRDPTITELKMIDTYWSDHCRHTTFNTQITDIELADPMVKATYEEYLAAREEVYGERAKTRPITMMDMGTIAAKTLKKRGVLKNLDESEEINACSVRANVKTDKGDEEWLFMFKNETHNHPTEIEPFGGAATCLGGAIRDPLSGRSYVYQAMRVTGAADPRKPLEETIPGKLPQRTITTTATQGYSSYGNQIGLATGLVDELYHPGYVAKRMEVGAVLGAAPIENVVREVPAPDDVIVLLGGRTGRDGCGGATGSSKSHTEQSLSTCSAEVQKGNPVEERKIQRLFRRPEISKLIKRCNDFGAGGVSVAIGELAAGLHIHLDRVPKKYEGLSATELAISESQERMAVVLAPESLEQFIKAADSENLEATVVAYVTEEPRLVMEYNGETIVNLSRAFLDSAGDTKTITVDVDAFPLPQEEEYIEDFDSAKALKELVGDLNICSRRGMVEYFDSTIGAGSVLIPFGGKTQLTPTQAMAAKIPVLEGQSYTASLFAYGFDPYLSSENQHVGAMCAVTESLARIVAAGGKTEDCYLTFQEYFPSLRGDSKRWAMPVSALLGAFKAQMAYGVGAIGGKDSMSGSFMDLDIPPTLISFAAGTVDSEKVLSPEFKAAGHEVYLFAAPYDEKGQPKMAAIKEMWQIVNKACEEGKVEAAWALGKGGVAEAVFKMALGNQIGFKMLESVYAPAMFNKNYGAIVVEANAPIEGAILIGHTTAEPQIVIGNGTVAIDELGAIWEGTLEDIFPTRTADKGTVEAYSYNTRPQYTAKAKIAKPKAVIPVFPGTNCEYDTARILERVGGKAEIVTVANLTPAMLEDSIARMEKALQTAQMMIFPGGFSFGDEPEGSGKFIAAFMRNPILKERIHELLYKNDGLILGICNGFQALIKLGLVPYGKIVDTDITSPTLTFNRIGRHQSRYVTTRIASVNSPWLAGVEVGDLHNIPISHGEGRFVCSDEMLAQLAANGQIATQYVDFAGQPSMDIAFNPNGSNMAIEGILSPDGRVFGKMGHSERIGTHIAKNIPGEKDQKIFESGVKYFL
ncbi:MAG: phosphoribosylformylglycinamidine synthase [Peptococcaceae bacterium]|nr:phosphoribosylformylglycinamidine synthase [Peptococcaceae bacterium]